MGAAAADQRTGSSAGRPMFGGAAAAGSMGGFGMSASEWAGGPQTAAQHNTNCSSVKEYAYNEDRN